ncbi:hypothetical protein C472_15279 [Halorubrum tebenquichense DSM 14210]|uniref:Uncharacterized protein n=2 Tax=Halorubrum tebenquichense TaxID=119434 RepID=M0DFB5_9EURY|nr:hypothetical protein C472_15279 [Halorubrum tebenquichense DSM 14210]
MIAVAIGSVIVSNRTQISEWRAWVVSERDNLLLIGGGSAVVVGLLSQLFQVELDTSGRFVSVIAHGTGFATGMVVMVLVLLLESVSR